jgi:transaldolase
MPENTLKAFADHGKVGDAIPGDGGDSEAVLAEFTKAGVDLAALARKLQADGASSFVTAWDSLMGIISSKGTALKKAAGAR